MFLTRLLRRYRFLIAFLLALGFSLLLSLASLTPSPAISVSKVPNPRQDNGWVTDTADLLSPNSEAKLNQIITALEETNGAEIAVVTVPDTKPSTSPKAFATELFNTWGIGKKGVDNGLLFLVSKNERRTEIETGYGLEAILPDAKVGNILRTQVTPQFKKDNFDAGIINGTQSIINLLQGQSFEPPTPLEQISRYTNWLFNGVNFCLIAMIILQKGMIKKGQRAIQITPVGRTSSVEPLPWVKHLYLPFQKTELGIVLNPGRRLFRKWWILFGLFAGLLFIGSVLRGNMLIMLLLSWTWFVYELGCWAKQALKRLKALKVKLLTLNAFLVVAVLLLIAFSIIPLLIFSIIFSITFQEVIVIPSILVAAFGGACAGSIRLLRSRSNPHEIQCRRCNSAMHCLSDDTLQQYLNSAEQTALNIKSTHYEGWQCPTCRSTQAANGLDLHVFSEVVRSTTFEHCKDCKALTIIRTSVILENATTNHTGKKQVTRQCACCRKFTTENSEIPRISSSSNFSSNPSSSSSSSSSGSSFGGGSSGGGGAGDSW